MLIKNSYKKVDEQALVLIINRLHHQILHTKSVNNYFNNFNDTHGGDIRYIIKIWNSCDCVSGYPYYKNYNMANMTTLSILFQPIHNVAFANGI